MLIIESDVEELQRDVRKRVPDPEVSEVPIILSREESSEKFCSIFFNDLKQLLKNFHSDKIRVVVFGGFIVKLALDKNFERLKQSDIDLTFLSKGERLTDEEVKQETEKFAQFLHEHLKKTFPKSSIQNSQNCLNILLGSYVKGVKYIQILTKVYHSWSQLFSQIDIAASAIAYCPVKNKLYFQEDTYEALLTRTMTIDFQRVVGVKTFERMCKYIDRGFRFRLPGLDLKHLFEFLFVNRRTVITVEYVEKNLVFILVLDCGDGEYLCPIDEENPERRPFQSLIGPDEFYGKAYNANPSPKENMDVSLPNSCYSRDRMRIFLQIAPLETQSEGTKKTLGLKPEPLHLFFEVRGKENFVRSVTSQGGQKFKIKKGSRSEFFSTLEIWYESNYIEHMLFDRDHNYSFTQNTWGLDFVLLIGYLEQPVILPSNIVDKVTLLNFQKELTIENSLPYYMLCESVNQGSVKAPESPHVYDIHGSKYQVFPNDEYISKFYSKIFRQVKRSPHYAGCANRVWLNDDGKSCELINFQEPQKQVYWIAFHFLTYNEKHRLSNKVSVRLWMGVVQICFEIGLISYLKNHSVILDSKSSDKWIRYAIMLMRLPDDLLIDFWINKWRMIHGIIFEKTVQLSRFRYIGIDFIDLLAPLNIHMLGLMSNFTRLGDHCYKQFEKYLFG